ncbi:MAG: Rpn family recombination-promoting nuclease/putative transposase [Bacteroidetes bacterium]|nr:Rpn family recombination-promoting nuclease/putative transposase [Bacteroidota bacterium]
MLKLLISFDWAVKRLLRNKANFGILEGFLSELLRQDIKIDRILESEGNQQHESDKFNRVDILAEDSRKQLIIIELQNNREVDYFQRMLFGASKAVTEYINLGDEYLKVRKVYSINIVYFDLGQGNDYVYHGVTHFTGLHTHEELMLSLRQQQLFMRQTAGALFPEYYVIKVNQFNDIAKDTLDEWIFYLKNGDIKEGSRAKGLAEVREKLTTDRLNKEDKATYLRHLDNLSNQKSVIFTAKDDGIAEGILSVARKMKANGEPVEKIIAFTGLSKEQIADIPD